MCFSRVVRLLYRLVCSTGGWIGCRPPSVGCVLDPFELDATVIGRDGDGGNFLTEKQPGKQHLGPHKNIEAGIWQVKGLNSPKAMLVFSNFSSAANNGKRRRHVGSSQLPGRGNELTGYLFLFPPRLVRNKSYILPLHFFFSFPTAVLKLCLWKTKLTQCSKQAKKIKIMQLCIAEKLDNKPWVARTVVRPRCVLVWVSVPRCLPSVLTQMVKLHLLLFLVPEVRRYGLEDNMFSMRLSVFHRYGNAGKKEKQANHRAA